MRLKSALLIVALAAMVGTFTTGAFADTLPSGQRTLGQATIEPAYNDLNGNVIYLLTPDHAKMRTNPRAWAPLYLVMYPTSAAGAVGTMNCAHQPMDNCPDHGPLVSGLAESVMPSVYGNGVWGHDHLVTGVPTVGGDFNIAWEPIAVLFTNSAAANTHLTTEAQVEAAVEAGDAIEIPLPQATFLCSVVSAATYNMGAPVTPAPSLP